MQIMWATGSKKTTWNPLNGLVRWGSWMRDLQNKLPCKTKAHIGTLCNVSSKSCKAVTTGKAWQRIIHKKNSR